MRIAVIGAGGVGGYFGGKLAQAGVDTTFVVRGATLSALRANGLRVDSIGGDFVVNPVQATDDPSTIGPVDAVFVTVKAWQIPEAVANIAPLLGADTVVVPLENGVEAPEQLAEFVGAEHAVAGLCGIVSFIVAPGHIRHAGAEPFIMFGEIDNRPSERLARLQQTLIAAGVPTTIPPDIHHSLWSKLLFIVPTSGVGAVTRVPMGVWRTMPGTRAIAESMLREIVAVATAGGVVLEPDIVPMTMSRIDGMPFDATTSMHRDLVQGRPSELDAQLGAVVRLGAQRGVPTPVTSILYACLLPQEQISRKEN
ncbi:MAG: 2-dehydropantoate 2-reductase [Acidobacteriota bacterium]|nr:2-dehydropantoate 2-reductase [Acidobacteriota bacterium]